MARGGMTPSVCGVASYWAHIAGDNQDAVTLACEGLDHAESPTHPDTTWCWYVLTRSRTAREIRPAMRLRPQLRSRRGRHGTTARRRARICAPPYAAAINDPDTLPQSLEQLASAKLAATGSAGADAGRCLDPGTCRTGDWGRRCRIGRVPTGPRFVGGARRWPVRCVVGGGYGSCAQPPRRRVR